MLEPELPVEATVITLRAMATGRSLLQSAQDGGKRFPVLVASIHLAADPNHRR
jgi:hypothetical protein